MKNLPPKVKVYGPNEVWAMSTAEYLGLIEEAHDQGLKAWQHDDSSLGFASYEAMEEYVACTGDDGWVEICAEAE
jgi:hypothetical protein